MGDEGNEQPPSKHKQGKGGAPSNAKRRRKKIKLRKRSVIHFVDLAGSERQQDYDADRMKESCQINKSLGVLSNVITSLTKDHNKGRFLHFRDSKLTFYLRDVFGGNSRTAIITNVLNEDPFYFETFNTLKFSASAKAIKTFPKANFVAEGSEEELQAEINHLMRKLSKLQNQSKGISNKEVMRLARKLKAAWEDTALQVEKNDLLAKNTLHSFSGTVKGVVKEITQSSNRAGGEYLYRTDIVSTIESIENFLEEKKVLTKVKLIARMKKLEVGLVKDLKKLKSLGQGETEGVGSGAGQRKKIDEISRRVGISMQGDTGLREGRRGLAVQQQQQSQDDQQQQQQQSYTHEYVQSLITRNKDYEDKIIELNKLNTDFVKNYQSKSQVLESENQELKNLIIEKADSLKKAEDEIFKFKKGRPLSEEESFQRNSNFEQFARGIKNGSVLSFRNSSKLNSENSSRMSSNTPTVGDLPLPQNSFDYILNGDFSKKGGLSVISSRKISTQGETVGDLPPPVISSTPGDSPQFLDQKNKPPLASDGFYRNSYGTLSFDDPSKLRETPSNQNSIPQNPSQYLQQHQNGQLNILKSKEEYLESLCTSKDEIIATLQNQLSYARDDEMGVIDSMRESIEGDYSKMRSLEINFEEAQKEIKLLRGQVTHPSSQRSIKRVGGGVPGLAGSSESRSRDIGLITIDYPDSFEDRNLSRAPKNPAVAGNSKEKKIKNTNGALRSFYTSKYTTSRNINKKNKSDRHSSTGRMSNSAHYPNSKEGGGLAKVTSQREKGRKGSQDGREADQRDSDLTMRNSFISQQNFRRNLENDCLESNLREKNREIIFYLKEIDKLQNENENLRDSRSSKTHLQAYKLKLQNKKLKDTLRKMTSGKTQKSGKNKTSNKAV